MPNDQTQPTDYQGQIEADAEQARFEADRTAALTRIREAAGLPQGAEEEIEMHFLQKGTREIEQTGRSDSTERWWRRHEAPLEWQQTESQLVAEMMQKAARYMQYPKCPDGHPAHRHLTPPELMRMNERDYRAKSEDEKWYAELSSADRKKFEQEYERRNRSR